MATVGRSNSFHSTSAMALDRTFSNTYIHGQLQCFPPWIEMFLPAKPHPSRAFQSDPKIAAMKKVEQWQKDLLLFQERGQRLFSNLSGFLSLFERLDIFSEVFEELAVFRNTFEVKGCEKSDELLSDKNSI